MSTTTQYAITQYPTPVFNTPDIAACFCSEKGPKLDDQGLFRGLETVLFPQSKVKLIKQVSEHIWQIHASEYHYDGSFYVDDRFLNLTTDEPPIRQPKLPSRDEILAQLQSLQPFRYIWGGNWPNGIELLSKLYPHPKKIKSHIQQLKGMDCSGLPHYLTDGYTPRNTSSLVHFGQPISIEGKNLSEIIKCLQPLDFIVWKGHVVWVIDQKTTIESKHPKGLFRSKLHLRLSEIIQMRIPIDKWRDGNHFVIRRWHPELLI